MSESITLHIVGIFASNIPNNQYLERCILCIYFFIDMLLCVGLLALRDGIDQPCRHTVADEIYEKSVSNLCLLQVYEHVVKLEQQKTWSKVLKTMFNSKHKDFSVLVSQAMNGLKQTAVALESRLNCCGASGSEWLKDCSSHRRRVAVQLATQENHKARA